MKKFFTIFSLAIFLCASCGTGSEPAADTAGGGETPAVDEASPDGSTAADVYWVSSSEGSDDNPGTIDRPLQTITKALLMSQAFETYKDIYVVGGDYDEDELLIYSGIGIYGGYGALTAAGTRERETSRAIRQMFIRV